MSDIHLRTFYLGSGGVGETSWSWRSRTDQHSTHFAVF